MTDEAQRLQRFKTAVYDEAKDKVQEILEAAHREAAELSGEADASAEHTLSEGKQAVDAEFERELRHRVSTAKLAAQRELLVYRGELAEKAFENVLSRLADFRQSKDYEGWLVSAVKAALRDHSGEESVTAIAPADMKYSKALEALGTRVEADSSIMLGGAAVSLPQRSIMLDCTFDSLVERERAEFTRTARLSI